MSSPVAGSGIRTHFDPLHSVSDTGAGIPSALVDKVFDPFFTTKEVGKGTGLGLSISYGIVKECQGEIVAESNPEGGACFRLIFPAINEDGLGAMDGIESNTAR